MFTLVLWVKEAGSTICVACLQGSPLSGADLSLRFTFPPQSCSAYVVGCVCLVPSLAGPRPLVSFLSCQSTVARCVSCPPPSALGASSGLFPTQTPSALLPCCVGLSGDLTHGRFSTYDYFGEPRFSVKNSVSIAAQ